ncbi:hypothetical protein ABJI51_16730 [Amycolatopsis sp. NEAU-NG30]|uniref:Uncharacterized protein n=1 Tax=Amycolatopsis melonis TaxID=3156488 RepID=A0ABV0LEK5_9PSEU
MTATVATLSPELRVLVRASNGYQFAGALICLACEHGYPENLAEEPELVEAAVRPDGQAADVLARLEAAGRAALDWLIDHGLPVGGQLLAVETGTDHLLQLQPAASGLPLARRPRTGTRR